MKYPVLISFNESDIPTLLKFLRLSKRMTQEEAAGKLKQFQRGWARYESGDSAPSIQKLEELLDVLGYNLILMVSDKLTGKKVMDIVGSEIESVTTEGGNLSTINPDSIK